MSLLQRSSLRYLLQHPWLMGLSVLGVALGVAVVVAIDLANVSAERAFALSAETVAGKATHQVVGAGASLDDDVYRRLRVEQRYRQAAPVVQGYATVPGSNRTFQLLGVDPFAEGPFRPYVGPGSELDLGTFMARPNTALLAAPTADELGVAVGDSLTIDIEGVQHPLQIVGLMAPDDERSRRATESLIVTDIATAQALLDMRGQLTRIDLILPSGAAGDRVRADLQSALPGGAQIRRSEARTETVEQMTRAFNLNLTALSLLALVVGAFLIYNTMTFSVVQRRPLIGRLRALGVTRREVFGLVLGEAALIGLVGTGIGLLLGIVLATGLVQLVTQTINDLYFVVTVRELAIAPFTLLKGAVLGLGMTLAAAVAPAREATNAPVNVVLQRSAQETGVRDLVPRLAGLGGLFGAVGAGLLIVSGQSIVWSYAGLLGIILAAALLAPAAIVGLARALRPLMNALFGVLGRMAARGVVSTLSRTSVAIAALMVAIAATVGVGIMVDSFRGTVESWLSHSLQADVYIQPPSLVFRRSNATLQRAVVDRIQSTEGVAGSHSVRRVDVQASVGPTELVAVDPGPNTPDVYRFKAGNPDAIWRDFEAEDFVLVSEPYAYRYGLGAGDTLRLQTDRGAAAFPIRGVFYDYGSDLGVVLTSRSTYTRHYDDRGISGVAVNAAPGQDVDALVERIRARAQGMQDIVVQSNRGLRESSMRIFDRTFTITTVLRLLAIVVAFIGVLSALMALQLEREREFGVLRATGMTPGQVGRYVTMQTGVMGFVAGLLSIPLGLALAYVLIFVINKRSFGWTLQLEVAPAILGQALLLGLAAALLAGAYPAWKMAQSNPSNALRE
jgi:putative ABC transport system permease protein